MPQETRSKKLERVKARKKIAHWLNWDQLVGKESGGAAYPSLAAVEGARNIAIWCIKKGHRYVRPRAT